MLILKKKKTTKALISVQAELPSVALFDVLCSVGRGGFLPSTSTLRQRKGRQARTPCRHVMWQPSRDTVTCQVGGQPCGGWWGGSPPRWHVHDSIRPSWLRRTRLKNDYENATLEHRVHTDMPDTTMYVAARSIHTVQQQQRKQRGTCTHSSGYVTRPAWKSRKATLLPEAVPPKAETAVLLFSGKTNFLLCFFSVINSNKRKSEIFHKENLIYSHPRESNTTIFEIQCHASRRFALPGWKLNIQSPSFSQRCSSSTNIALLFCLVSSFGEPQFIR